MASKKVCESISVLSMYNEEDDDLEQDIDGGLPETEGGGIVETGRVAELETVNGTPPGTIQSFEYLEPSHYVTTNHKRSEFESVEPEDAVKITEDEQKEMDPLDKVLPSRPMTKCSDELQEKIIKFLVLKKKTGRSFNSEVRNRKEYRNPDFLLHAVTYQDIDPIGSCFSKDVFDPHGYDKSDYYDEIGNKGDERHRREGQVNGS